MRIEFGDILEVDEGYILHQVNCQHVAGAGLARSIAGKYPSWLRMYKMKSARLGTSWVYQADEDLFIVSLYAQDRYGTDKQYTDYSAFENALLEFKTHFYNPVYDVYAPFGIGAGLGGGDWAVIRTLLGGAFDDIVIMKLENHQKEVK